MKPNSTISAAPSAKSQVTDILISDIAIVSNTRTEFDQADIKELSENIKVHGVIQAIIVRPCAELSPSGGGSAKRGGGVPLQEGATRSGGGGKFKYELVCGERRVRASKLAGNTTIPANIRVMTDEEVIEIQIIENLMRKDISPLDEAAAFKSILDTHKINVQELCKRIGKEKDYINRRLHLNEMITEFKKMLHEGKMLLGHAFCLCRLTTADQTEFYNQLKKENSLNIIHEQTVTQLQEDIDRTIVRNLDNAPFDTKDAALIVTAGACTVCPKRAGANPDLFGDVKSLDSCFDKNCYQSKSDTAFKLLMDKALANPDMLFIEGWSNQKDAQVDILKKAGHKVYKEHSGAFVRVERSTPGATKAFCVAGRDKGKTTYIKLQESAKSDSSSPAKKSPAQKKQEMEQQIKRGRQEDAEAIFEKITERLSKIPAYKRNAKEAGAKLKPEEQQAVMLILLDKADYDFQKRFEDKDGDLLKGLSKAKAETLNAMTRSALDELIDYGDDEIPMAAARLVGSAYFPKEIAEWEKEQAEVRRLREAKLTAVVSPSGGGSAKRGGGISKPKAKKK